MAIKFDVLNRFSGAVQFTAEIECAEDALPSVKMGLAVRWAVKARANLTGANLAGADLTGANLADANLADANLADANLTRAYLAGADLTRAYLAGADLTGADLIDGGQRSDGYRFIGSIKDGLLMITAGCRHFDIATARTHWKHRDGTPLGAETTCILDHIEAVANIRGLIKGKAA